MTHHDSVAWQARRIRASLAPGVDYLNRLRTRVDQTFPPSDPLSVQVANARAATTELVRQLEAIEDNGATLEPGA